MKANLNGFIVEFGHTIEEYEKLYKEDYDMIDKIKQSGKLYGSL